MFVGAALLTVGLEGGVVGGGGRGDRGERGVVGATRMIVSGASPKPTILL